MADLSNLLLPTDLSAQGLTPADGRQLKSYLYQLTEQLRYVLGNLDGDNMSAAYNESLAGTDTRLARLTARQQADIAALRADLAQAHSRITELDSGLARWLDTDTGHRTLPDGAGGYFDFITTAAGLGIQWREGDV